MCFEIWSICFEIGCMCFEIWSICFGIWSMRVLLLQHTCVMRVCILCQARMILRALKLSVEIEDIVTASEDLINYPPDLAKKFLDTCCSYCKVISWLAGHFHTKPGAQGRYFNYTYKFHELMHVGHASRFLNPVLGWCYQGEDLLQRVKKIVGSAARLSKSRPHVANMALDKYVRGYEYQLESGPARG